MTTVALKKQTGFNQDFEFRCLGGKYQDLFFNQVSNRTNSKQEKIRIPCLPTLPMIPPYNFLLLYGALKILITPCKRACTLVHSEAIWSRFLVWSPP